jgi:hypothetical protein
MKLILIFLSLFSYKEIYGQKPVKINQSTLDSILPYVKLVKSQWIFAAESVDHNGFYIRDSYVSKDESEIKIWVKIIYPTYTFKKRVYNNAYKLTLCTFDYVNTKMKVTSETNYTAKGNVITPFNTGDQEWQEIIAESVFEAVYKKVLEVFVN